MTDERQRSSRGKESVARTTARDVPFVRGAGDDSEPAPRAQRAEQLPRDPTYEAELAQVELAVLRDPARREEPSTKQGGGRRAHDFQVGSPPESVTPESPGAGVRGDARSPEPPSSTGRALASGTLLSVGAVDPRGKTERTLETPRMFFSRPDQGAEAYFKPGKIPAVTVHQTLETETVKLADSIDPRRAKTIPRLDRETLARLAARTASPDSEAPVAASQPADTPELASDVPAWSRRDDYEDGSSVGAHGQEGQIHASLSPFRAHAEPSFSMDGAETRPEPYVVRRSAEASEPSRPESSLVPTHRDLPQHRIEASRPPPAAPSVPAPASESGRSHSAVPLSEGVGPTTASIAAESPSLRPAWGNYAAFAAALLVALGLGWWLTSGGSEPGTPSGTKEVPASVKPSQPALLAPSRPVDVAQSPTPSDAAGPAEPVRSAPVSPPSGGTAVVSPKSTAPSVSPAAPPVMMPRKSTPTKPTRETIF